MSDQAARQLIENYLAAFNAGDHEAMLALVADDVAFDRSGSAREIGKDRMRWLLGLRARHFRETVSDVVVMVAEGGIRAASEFSLRGVYLTTEPGLPEASGQSFTVPAAMFFEIDDGVFSRITEYRDLVLWREQLARG